MGGSVRPPSVLRGGVARSGARFSAVSAPSLRTLACTAQLSCCLYGSGSAAIRFETARERRRRHRRSAPARHHWKDTVAFHGCCEMLNTSPHLALPHAATRPPPARAALTGPYWGCFETFQSSSGARERVCWRLSGHELCTNTEARARPRNSASEYRRWPDTSPHRFSCICVPVHIDRPVLTVCSVGASYRIQKGRLVRSRSGRILNLEIRSTFRVGSQWGRAGESDRQVSVYRMVKRTPDMNPRPQATLTESRPHPMAEFSKNRRDSSEIAQNPGGGLTGSRD